LDHRAGGVVDDRNLVLTISEAAVLLRISRGLAYELARRNELPVMHLGRRVMVSRRALDDFLLGRMDKPQTAGADDRISNRVVDL
jgi:excisionase family DNA binding protein